MALVRCHVHGRPRGRTQVYVLEVKPVGFPQTAAICGLKRCENPGSVWLTAEEESAYEKGQRIFEVPNAAVKIKVELGHRKSQFWDSLSRAVFAGSGHLTWRHGNEWPCDFWLAQLFNGRIVVQVSNVQGRPGDVGKWLEQREPLDLFGTLDDGRNLVARGIHWTWIFHSKETLEGAVHRPNCVEITDPDSIGVPVRQVICEVTNLLLNGRIEPIELDDGVQIRLGRSSDHNDNRRRIECLKTAGVLGVVSIQLPRQTTADRVDDLVGALDDILSLAQRSSVHCVAQHWKNAEDKGMIVRSKYQEPVFYYPAILRPLVPADSLASFVQDTFETYLTQWKAWDLGHAIDHYIQAMALRSTWSQAVGFFTALETLKNAFVHPSTRAQPKYHVPKGEFKEKDIVSQIVALLESNFAVFKGLPEHEKDLLRGKIGGLNRRAYKPVLRKLFKALSLTVEDDELNRLVEFRNQIIHRGSPDYTGSLWKDPAEAGDDVARFAGLVERSILAVLGYHGSFERYDEIFVSPDE